MNRKRETVCVCERERERERDGVEGHTYNGGKKKII